VPWVSSPPQAAKTRHPAVRARRVNGRNGCILSSFARE
jgi:hypothetical protein